MLRRTPPGPESAEDQPLITGRALLIIVASAGISLIVGGSAATVGWLGAVNLASPAAGILVAAAAGLSATTLTFIKAIGLLHGLVR